jgi:hypothetical protein
VPQPNKTGVFQHHHLKKAYEDTFRVHSCAFSTTDHLLRRVSHLLPKLCRTWDKLDDGQRERGSQKIAPIVAQQLTSNAQASGVITASNQVEQMEVGLRSKRANEQPQDATIQSSPTSAKNAPPLRAPGSEKSKAS